LVNSKFLYSQNPENYDKVKSGTVVLHDGEKNYIADRDCILVLPTPKAWYIWNEICYFAKEVKRHFIFWYGIYINEDFVRNLGITWQIFPVKINGVKRSWKSFSTISGNNMTLSLTVDNDYLTNGVLIEVDEETLKKLDEREKKLSFDRVFLDKERIEFYRTSKLPEAEFYTYIYNENLWWHIEKNWNILKSYIDAIFSWCLWHRKKFLTDFINSTYNWKGNRIQEDTQNTLYNNFIREDYKEEKAYKTLIKYIEKIDKS